MFDSVCALLLFEMFDLCRLNVRFQRMMGLWLPMLDLECNMTMLEAQWKAESVTILRLSSFFVFFFIIEMIVHVDIYNACWSYFDLGFWVLGFGQVQFFYLFKINVRLQVVVWTICFVMWNLLFFLGNMMWNLDSYCLSLCMIKQKWIWNSYLWSFETYQVKNIRI